MVDVLAAWSRQRMCQSEEPPDVIVPKSPAVESESVPEYTTDNVDHAVNRIKKVNRRIGD